MANKTLLAQIKQRSDTAANWTAKNPIISDGELIIVTTNAGEKRFKVGDGEKTFTQLPYADENILSKIKNYTAGDGINISDAGVISSTGGGSGSDVFVIEIDESNNIITPFDDIKNAIQNHRILIRSNNDFTAPLIGAYYTTTDHDDVIQLLYQAAEFYQVYSLQRPLGSTTVTQNFDQYVVPLASYSNPPASGTAYWNSTNKSWEIKDIASGSDTFYFEMSIDNNTEKITRLTKTYTEISEAIQARKNILVYIDGDLRPVVRSFTHDSYLQFFLQGNNYCVMCQLNSDNTSVCIRYLSPYIDKQSLESDVSGTVYWNPRNRSWSIKPAYKAGNGISISNDGTISVTAAKIYSGTSNAPSADLGENGDIYIQTEG